MSFRHFANAMAVIAALLLPSAAFAAENEPVPTEAKRFGTWGFDLDGMDRSVKPGDDFFKYANGKWHASTTIPADRTSFGAFAILRDLSEARVRAILDRWAADKNLKAGSDEAKVATLYRTFLDEAAVEKLDAKPLEAHLAAVKKVETHADMARLIGRTPTAFGRRSSVRGVRRREEPGEVRAVSLAGRHRSADREYYLNE
jgi:putative endopeptidase